MGFVSPLVTRTREPSRGFPVGPRQLDRFEPRHGIGRVEAQRVIESGRRTLQVAHFPPGHREASEQPKVAGVALLRPQEGLLGLSGRVTSHPRTSRAPVTERLFAVTRSLHDGSVQAWVGGPSVRLASRDLVEIGLRHEVRR